LKTTILKVACIALAVCLSGCATREYTTVAMAQPGDDALTCGEIQKQMADNEAVEAQHRKADKDVEAGNIAKGVGSAIPYAGILIAASTDLSNEEQAKARALADRNERLAALAKQKNCPQ